MQKLKVDGCGESRILGIGPVIADWNGSRHSYYVETVGSDATVERRWWEKQSRKADRAAKLAAIRFRIEAAKKLRSEGGIVLLHDLHSFQSFVGIVAAGIRTA